MEFDAFDRAQTLVQRTVVAVLIFVAVAAAHGHAQLGIAAARGLSREVAQAETPQAPQQLASPVASMSPGQQLEPQQSAAPEQSPVPSPTPTMTPIVSPGIGGTPYPLFVTPPPNPEDFPRINRGATPIPTQTPSPPPNPEATPAPSPLPSGIARVTADELYGNNGPTGGFTAYGHVHLEYSNANVTADQAVYDATTKILRATGHVHVAEENGDTATASALEYHSDTDRSELFDVEGSTAAIYFQGEQIQGHLYYKGKEATLDPGGHTIIKDGWISTCEPGHVAYHITGREIEIRPHDRLIAKGSTLFLGAVAVAALGVLALPLTEIAQRHPTSYTPRIGYNSVYGVFIREFINFYRGPNWYGTYHIDFYQKVGIGLGADFYFQRLDGKGGGEFTFYELNNNAEQQALSGTRKTITATLNMQRLFTPHLDAAISVNYSGQSAVFTALPTTTSANLSVTHSGERSTTSYIVTDNATGPSHAFGGIVQHTVAFSPAFTQSVGFNLQDNTNPGAFSSAIGFNWDTHLTAHSFDADLVISTNHGQQINGIGTDMETSTPVIGIQRVPELSIRARPFQISNLRLPVSAALIDGIYDDGYDNIETSRLDFNAQLGPGIYRIGDEAVINAGATVHQDAYGTGDLQGALGFQGTLQNFFGHHADNTLIYTDQSVRGYTPMPSLDKLTGSNQISEVLNVYNASFYRFTASTNYDFTTKFLSTINYQLTVDPSPYSFINLGTSYDPHGTGYSPLVISLAAPVTRTDYVQFSGDYDFQQHSLQGQNWYLTHTVSNCYVVRIAYLQPLKEVDVSLALLAFPGQTASFGINNNGPIIAQPFAY